MSGKKENPFDILGVSTNASMEQMKEAFNKRVLQTHPDKTGKDTSDEYRKVMEAWKSLKNPAFRSARAKAQKTESDENDESDEKQEEEQEEEEEREEYNSEDDENQMNIFATARKSNKQFTALPGEAPASFRMKQRVQQHEREWNLGMHKTSSIERTKHAQNCAESLEAIQTSVTNTYRLQETTNQQQQTNSQQKPLHICPTCKKEFTTLNTLDSHIDSTHMPFETFLNVSVGQMLSKCAPTMSEFFANENYFPKDMRDVVPPLATSGQHQLPPLYFQDWINASAHIVPDGNLSLNDSHFPREWISKIYDSNSRSKISLADSTNAIVAAVRNANSWFVLSSSSSNALQVRKFIQNGAPNSAVSVAPSFRWFSSAKDKFLERPTVSVGQSVSMVDVSSLSTTVQQQLNGFIPNVNVKSLPEMLPDTNSLHCNLCANRFSFFAKDRHHCRSDGKLVCSQCSTSKRPLVQFGILSPVRICDSCATSLAKEDCLLWIASIKTRFQQTIANNPTTSIQERLKSFCQILDVLRTIAPLPSFEEQIAKEGSAVADWRLASLFYGSVLTRVPSNFWATTFQRALSSPNSEKQDILFLFFAAKSSVAKDTWINLIRAISDIDLMLSCYIALDLNFPDSSLIFDEAIYWNMNAKFSLSFQCLMLLEKSGKRIDKFNTDQRRNSTPISFQITCTFFNTSNNKFSTNSDWLRWFVSSKASQTSPFWLYSLSEITKTSSSINTARWLVSQAQSTLSVNFLKSFGTKDVSAMNWIDLIISLSSSVASAIENARLIKFCLVQVNSLVPASARLLERGNITMQSLLLFCSHLLLKETPNSFWRSLSLEIIRNRKYDLSDDDLLFVHRCISNGTNKKDLSTEWDWLLTQMANETTKTDEEETDISFFSLRCQLFCRQLFPNNPDISVVYSLLDIGLIEAAFILLAMSVQNQRDQTKSEEQIMLIDLFQDLAFSKPGFLNRTFPQNFDWERVLFCGLKKHQKSLPELLTTLLDHLTNQRNAAYTNEEKFLNSRISGEIASVRLLFESRSFEQLFSILLKPLVTNDLEMANAFASIFIQRSNTVKESLLPIDDRAVLCFSRAVQSALVNKVDQFSQDVFQCYCASILVPGLSNALSSLLTQPKIQQTILNATLRDLSSIRQILQYGQTNSLRPSLMLSQPIVSVQQYCGPIKQRFQKFLRQTRELRGFRVAEKDVRRSLVSNPLPFSNTVLLDAAYTWIDLSGAALDSNTTIGCFLTAGRLFVELVCSNSITAAQRYAYCQVVIECLVSATAISLRLAPLQRIETARVCTGMFVELMRNNSAREVLNGSDFQCFDLFLRTSLSMLPLCPITWAPEIACFDRVFASLCSYRLQQSIYFMLSNSSSSTSVVPSHVLAYYLFEGRWQGWIAPEEAEPSQDRQLVAVDEFIGAKMNQNTNKPNSEARSAENDSRVCSMAELLKSKGWSSSQVQQLVQSLPLPRDSNGFLLNTTHSLGSDKIYSSIDGFQFDTKTGTLELLLSPATSKSPGLFGQNDIVELFSAGVASSYFSLDHPTSNGLFEYHPFQNMRYGPTSLRGTSLVATMFHTDYLLKFFSSGVEVSGLAPFHTRPVQDGLLVRLPQRLQNSIRPIFERRSKSQVGEAHRFWIEAGEIPFNSDKSNSSKLSIVFGNPKMIVKKHLLKKDHSTGELVDATDDPGDDTPEAMFARDFSSNYEEIGKYFPEFLRLRELFKICGVWAQVNNIASSIKELISDSRKQQEIRTEIYNDQLEHFRSMSSSLPSWPSADDSSAVEEAIQRILPDIKRDVERQGFTWYSQQSQLMPKIRSQILTAMREADSKFKNDLASKLAQQISCSQWDISNQVDSFLRYKDGSGLASKIADFQLNQEIAKTQAVISRLESQRFKIKDPKTQPSLGSAILSNSECSWVPAAFRKDQGEYSCAVYGGVSLNVAFINQKFLNPPPTSSYQLAPTTLNAQRSNSIPNSVAQKMDNLQTFNQRFFQSQQFAASQAFFQNQQRAAQSFQQQRQQQQQAPARPPPSRPANGVYSTYTGGAEGWFGKYSVMTKNPAWRNDNVQFHHAPSTAQMNNLKGNDANFAKHVPSHNDSITIGLRTDIHRQIHKSNPNLVQTDHLSASTSGGKARQALAEHLVAARNAYRQEGRLAEMQNTRRGQNGEVLPFGLRQFARQLVQEYPNVYKKK